MKESGPLQTARIGRQEKRRDAERNERLRLLEAHNQSALVSTFYNAAIDKAMEHGMTPSAAALIHLQQLDAATLYAWCQNQALWDEQPAEVRAFFEIALTIAKADLKGKGKSSYILAVGEGQGAMIPEDDVYFGVGNEDGFGMSDPDTKVVAELYKLLGLEEKMTDIPAIPKFSRYVHTDVMRVHDLPDFGVRLRFNFSGSSTGEFSNGSEVPFYPAHVGMSIHAKKPSVK